MKEMLIINVRSDAVLRIFYLQIQSPQVFCKKGVLTNFIKFAEKQLYRTLFLKKLFKEILLNLQEKPVPVSLFIKISSRQSPVATLLKMLPCEFCEIFKNTLLQSASGRLLLYKILRIFFEYCEIFKNNFHFEEHLRKAASDFLYVQLYEREQII